MSSTNDFSYLQGDYSQYSLGDREIQELADTHSKLVKDVKSARDKSNRSEEYIGGGYVTAIVGPILVIVTYLLIHVLSGGNNLFSNLKGLKHFRKIFTTKNKGKIVNNGMNGRNGNIVNNGMNFRNGISALIKLIIYAGLIVAFTAVASKVMIIPHNKKYRQYNREKSRLIEERDKAKRELDKAQRKLDSSSA